jgi:hypothetical protein
MIELRTVMPAVGKIRTEIIWEHLEADESFDEVANEFDLTVNEVRWLMPMRQHCALREARRDPLYLYSDQNLAKQAQPLSLFFGGLIGAG